MVIDTCDDVGVAEVLARFHLLIESFSESSEGTVAEYWGRTRSVVHLRLVSLCRRLDDEYAACGCDETCLWFLLDRRSFKATYFIDIFCQMEWLLTGLLSRSSYGPFSAAKPSYQVTVKFARGRNAWNQGQYWGYMPYSPKAAVDLLRVIQPALDTCRYIYAACTFSAAAHSEYLTTPKSWSGMQHSCFVGCNAPVQRYDCCQMSLQVFLESVVDKEQPESAYTSAYALVDKLDFMLEIASIMRSLEEQNRTYGHLSPKSLILYSGKDWPSGTRIKLNLEPSRKALLPGAGNCYIAPEIATYGAPGFNHKTLDNFWSDVYSYGSVCFNILTVGVRGALKSMQTIGSRSKFYEFVRRGKWKQWVKDQPEYLVSLIAWCWETDPSKRPTFATICSLLQRAMRCLITPPVINLTRLSNFQQHREYGLLNLYLSFTWSRDMRCRLIGTNFMNELLEAFATEIIELQHFSSDLMCKKIMQAVSLITTDLPMTSHGFDVPEDHIRFIRDRASKLADLRRHTFTKSSYPDGQRLSKMHQKVLKSVSQFSKMFRAGSWQCFAASTKKSKIRQGFSEAKRGSIPDFSQIIFEERHDLTSLAGEMTELEKKSDIFLDVALTVGMVEQHSTIFQALAYDCMVAEFPSLDYRFWIRPLINSSHSEQKLIIPRPKALPQVKSEFEINHSLLPRLVCFWEGWAGSQRTQELVNI